MGKIAKADSIEEKGNEQRKKGTRVKIQGRVSRDRQNTVLCVHRRGTVNVSFALSQRDCEPEAEEKT